MNLWATLLGALFCLPCGWLLDRFGTRTVFLAVTAALGATVLAMSRWTTGSPAYSLHLPLPSWIGGDTSLVLIVDLFVFLLLTRGLGQSALSVVSLALIGRSAGRRSGLAMGVYAFCTTAGFLGAFIVLGGVVKNIPQCMASAVGRHWRGSRRTRLDWRALGAKSIPGDRPGGSEFHYSRRSQPDFETGAAYSRILDLYAGDIVLWAGRRRHFAVQRVHPARNANFDKEVFVTVTQIGVPVGLAANLLVGWLATRYPLHRLIGIATALFAATLLCFPHITTKMQVYGYAISLAAVGGAITVCFFTVYRQAFGPARLGSIQGLAQMITVLFSAVGPLIFASTQARLGSYAPLFPVLAGIALVLAVACWMFRLPVRMTNAASPRAPQMITATRTIRPSASILSAEQLRAWDDDGFIVLPRFFPARDIGVAAQEANELLDRHRELIDTKNLRCRFQPNVEHRCVRVRVLRSGDRPVACLPSTGARCSVAGRSRRAVWRGSVPVQGQAHLTSRPGVKGYDLHQDYISWPSFPPSFLDRARAIRSSRRDRTAARKSFPAITRKAC